MITSPIIFQNLGLLTDSNNNILKRWTIYRYRTQLDHQSFAFFLKLFDLLLYVNIYLYERANPANSNDSFNGLLVCNLAEYRILLCISRPFNNTKNSRLKIALDLYTDQNVKFS